MEEAPENGKESSHSAHANGMNEFIPYTSSFGGLGVACWPLVPKFAGLNPAEAVGFLR